MTASPQGGAASLFAETLTDLAETKRIGANVTEELMRRLAERGMTLAQMSDRRIMDRSLYTLKKRARQFGIAFPDYVPRALKKGRAE